MKLVFSVVTLRDPSHHRNVVFEVTIRDKIQLSQQLTGDRRRGGVVANATMINDADGNSEAFER